MDRAVAEIDVVALRQNLFAIRRKTPGCKIMAMVKGNAYGHGIVTISKHLLDADYFGVACIDEALALRHSGIIQPIVLTTGFYDKDDLDILIEHNIQPVIFSDEQIELIKKAKPKNPLNVWLKVNTGMNRLGFSPEGAPAAWQKMYMMKEIADIKWMTHFASANVFADPLTESQIELFEIVTQEMETERSASNSAAICQYPEAHYDIVRPGIMLYGVSPIKNNDEHFAELEPVMTLKARVIALNTISMGDSVGYSAKWRAPKASKVALVSIGYGDGYPQAAPEGTPVLVRGKEAEIVGRVSMDTLTIDVSELKDVNLNDEVILWGRGMPVERVADYMDVSPYVLLTGVSSRVKRFVLGFDDDSEVSL